MNVKHPREHLLRRWVIATLALTLGALTYGQEPLATPTPTPDPLAGIPVQVLDQERVIVGKQTITYNRIAPPVFPFATPAPSPEATSVAEPLSQSVQTVPIKKTISRSSQINSKKTTRSTQSDDGSSDYKKCSALFFSVTVYDHQLTALRWYDGVSPDLQAYVNLDFEYFSTITTFETDNTVYNLIFAISNDTAESLTQAGQPLPVFSSNTTGHSGFQIIAGDPSAHPEAIAALTALCAYYDAKSAQMIAAYNQQQANNAAYQQWLQANPPTQLNTVINFWPIKSNLYPVNH